MNEICLPEVFLADFIGVLLMTVIFMGKAWKVQTENHEDRLLFYIIILVMISCIADTLSFYLDGKSGAFMRVILYITNYWIFCVNSIIEPLWMILIYRHINGRDSKAHLTFVYIVCSAGYIALLINIFSPIVFSIDSANVYHRGPFYWIYNLIASVFIIDGFIGFLLAKSKGGRLKFFPVLQFILPVVICFFIQTEWYGVSTIWPGIAVGVTGVVIGLQREYLYVDGLTGLFNRFYLEEKKKQYKNDEVICAMMLDMNNFKSINDTYGHSEGDAALITTAGVLKRCVGDMGTVIRYAGDEFVIILDTHLLEVADGLASSIKRCLEKVNEETKKEYILSVSIGCSVFNAGQITLDDIMKEVDAKMYKDKKNYYEKHDRRRELSLFD